MEAPPPSVVASTHRKSHKRREKRTPKLRSVQTEHVRSLFRPFARARAGVGTGTTPHFKMWMADLKLKSTLQRISLASVADRHDNVALATAYALLFGAGIKNVYDLSQADARNLLQVKGIGPRKLEAIKADLASHQVAVRW